MLSVIGILFLLLTIYALYNLFIRKKYKLTTEKKKSFQKLFLQITKQESGKAQIIELDKLLHKILLALGFTGTFGEILKKNPNILQDWLQEIWNHHKLRNKLVHEFSDENNKKLSNSARGYGKIIKNILERL